MKPVPERARAYLLTHWRQTQTQQAQALGISRRTITRYRAALRREGVIRHRYERCDVETITEALTDGAPLDALAREQRVTTKTVWWRLRLAGLTVRDVTREHVYSAREVLRIIGCPGGHGTARIRAWYEAGLLRASFTRGGHWRITAIALQEFLEHPQCPLDPARIVDPDWRAYAEAARAGHLKPPAPDGVHLCAQCGARVVSKDGKACLSCATAAGIRRKRERHAETPRAGV